MTGARRFSPRSPDWGQAHLSLDVAEHDRGAELGRQLVLRRLEDGVEMGVGEHLLGLGPTPR